GRGPRCVLMVMVDDATNRMRARFFEEETTRASYDVLEGWGRKHGLPASLYVDRDSIYRCEGVASIAEQLAGKERQTQFGRAMEALGVELILANSPQAKGRVPAAAARKSSPLKVKLLRKVKTKPETVPAWNHPWRRDTAPFWHVLIHKSVGMLS